VAEKAIANFNASPANVVLLVGVSNYDTPPRLVALALLRN
jgi:hypothetical protein